MKMIKAVTTREEFQKAEFGVKFKPGDLVIVAEGTIGEVYMKLETDWKLVDRVKQESRHGIH